MNFSFYIKRTKPRIQKELKGENGTFWRMASKDLWL